MLILFYDVQLTHMPLLINKNAGFYIITDIISGNSKNTATPNMYAINGGMFCTNIVSFDSICELSNDFLDDDNTNDFVFGVMDNDFSAGITNLSNFLFLCIAKNAKIFLYFGSLNSENIIFLVRIMSDAFNETLYDITKRTTRKNDATITVIDTMTNP